MVALLLSRNTEMREMTCERDGTRRLTASNPGAVVATDAQRAVAEKALAAAGHIAIDVCTYDCAWASSSPSRSSGTLRLSSSPVARSEADRRA